MENTENSGQKSWHLGLWGATRPRRHLSFAPDHNGAHRTPLGVTIHGQTVSSYQIDLKNKTLLFYTYSLSLYLSQRDVQLLYIRGKSHTFAVFPCALSVFKSISNMHIITPTLFILAVLFPLSVFPLPSSTPASLPRDATLVPDLIPRAPGYCQTTVRENRYKTFSGDKIYTFRIDIPAYRSSSGTLTKDCLMNTGAKGDGVRALQHSINNCYVGVPVRERLAEDGDYGELTKAAVRKVQKYVGAGVDGVYGEQTYSLMNFFGNPVNYPVGWCVQGGVST